MKYKLYTILSLFLWHTNTIALNDFTNQTNMFIRPIFDSVSIQQASWDNIVYQKQKKGLAAQIITAYEQSYDNLLSSSYFLFDFKNNINISSGVNSTFLTSGTGMMQEVSSPGQNQMNVPSLQRDVLGQWLGLNDITDQSLTISLQPQQRQACALLEVSQDLKTLLNWAICENWFVNFSMPVTWIENNIGITGDKKAVSAFSQPGFNYVNMIAGDQTSIRITQATLSLGTKYMSENDIQVITSTGIIVPLVEEGQNRSLFTPTQGFNTHFGLDNQVHFQFPIIKKIPDSPSRILLFIDIHNNFLCRNHQLRSYDIKNKPFSRYMKLLDQQTNELIPAMNALTIRSKVEPFNLITFATGFKFSHKESFGEVGYELWAHGSEVVTPEPKITHEQGQWQDNRYGIAFINADGVLAQINNSTGTVEALTVGTPGLTASSSTINYISAPDGQFSCCPTPAFLQKNKFLTLKDLDRTSCAARSTITHKAFFCVGVGQKGEQRDNFMNFGAFIQVAQNNSALCSWGGWLKAGLTF